MREGEDADLKFPVELKDTFHAYGGRIVRIERIACDRSLYRGGASNVEWYFVGSVLWDNGSTSERIDIPLPNIRRPTSNDAEASHLIRVLEQRCK